MTAFQALELVLPHEKYRESFLAAYEELPEHEQDAWIYMGPDGTEDLIYNRFADYVAALRRFEVDPPSHFVRGRTYWGIRGAEVVGRIGLRLELNDFLARLGGHVGYIVRPSARGQGVAANMLAHVLTTPEAKAIGKLLITCDEGNTASERVILRNGGVYESTVCPEDRPVGKKRFWIDAS